MDKKKCHYHTLIMRNNFFETIVGAIVLVIAASFFVYVFKKNHTSNVEQYPLYALFDKIDGLKKGNDVKIGGVTVGTIANITLHPETYMAKVELTVDKNISIPEDSSADIVSESLLGGKYISLVPGNSQEELEAGGTIEDTQSSVNFEQLIGKYMFDKNSNDKPEKKEEDNDSVTLSAEPAEAQRAVAAIGQAQTVHHKKTN